MKKISLFFLFLIGPSTLGYGMTGQSYLERFTTYLDWSQNLPAEPNPTFLQFIDDETPLAKKLREKWLYQIAREKKWELYLQHYKPTADVNLQCFAQIANYHTGRQQEALQGAHSIWLSGNSLPAVCNSLFSLMLQDKGFNQHLITQRIILALEKGNLGLARFLLKQYKQPRFKEEQLITAIHQSPRRIAALSAGELHDYFYLYGLKRMVASNMALAIKFWQMPKTQKILNDAQKQAFLGHLSLYKAMRNHPDASAWFRKIKPRFYTDLLLDWQIRLALKNQNWPQVETLISHAPAKEEPGWQYWLARAKEAKGEKQKAHEIYENLAKSRHYYGFLASLRINQIPHFADETTRLDTVVLKPYQPLTDIVKKLYNAKQPLQASQLLNDFMSELPKEEKSALIYWIANELKWYGKSVHLSNTEELANQLALRFPIIHQQAIRKFAKNYRIDQELIYAIIRQESGFREDVVSPVGARGLMQLMPSTANVVARREKISYHDKNQLFFSDKNINIGVAYLKQLTLRYAKHPVLVAAAYNAGPSQVNYWLKNHPPREIDIWIDTLPWRETRNYLKNIIAFYAVYQYRLQHRPNLQAFMRPFFDIR